jgi:PIN domain nuclease of toxin-antitoxin system
MRLLLDSHALLWFCEGSASLSTAARSAIEDLANENYVSHATACEVAIKVRLGKLKLLVSYDDFFPGALVANGFRPLAPEFHHFRELLSLPLHRRDPFDRLIVVQAQVEGLTVVSGDPQFQPYGVPVLW